MNEENIDYSRMSTEEKVRHFENAIVQSPVFKVIQKRINSCRLRAKYTTEPRGLLLTADSGNGKTTTGSFYLKDYPRTVGEEGTIIPVLLCSVPSPATIKGMGSSMLRDLGDPLWDRGTTGSITGRLCILIKECKVELIIMDEFQDLIDKDTERVFRSCADWIKHILNKTGVPMVLMGLPKSADILNGNDQLKRRFSTRLALTAFGWSTEVQQKEFTNFLILLEKSLLFPSPSKLYSGYMPFRLFCATRGVIANMKNLISKAAEMGFERGSDCITLDLLALAYDEELANDGGGEINPFRVDAGTLKLPVDSVPAEPTRGVGAGRRGRPKGSNRPKVKISTVLHK